VASWAAMLTFVRAREVGGCGGGIRRGGQGAACEEEREACAGGEPHGSADWRLARPACGGLRRRGVEASSERSGVRCFSGLSEEDELFRSNGPLSFRDNGPLSCVAGNGPRSSSPSKPKTQATSYDTA
jgi:hypothetical protein